MPCLILLASDSSTHVSSWFFDGWTQLLRVPLIAMCAYIGLVALLRISGKRTLSKLNAFDLVVTVALGSTLAATLLNDSVALAEGLVAFATLIGIQFVVAWTCARYDLADQIVKARPTIVLWRGEILRDVMVRERVSEEEVLSAVRAGGHASYEDVGAVILETTGDFTVMDAVAVEVESKSALEHVTDRPGDN